MQHYQNNVPAKYPCFFSSSVIFVLAITSRKAFCRFAKT